MLAFRKAERETQRARGGRLEWREGGERGFLLFLWHQRRERDRGRAEIVALGNEGATLYSDPVAAAELATSALTLPLPLNTVMVM